jgi:hypothetical protein
MSKHKKSHRAKSKTIPVAVMAPIVFEAIILGKNAMSGSAGLKSAKESVTGFDDNGLRTDLLIDTYGPILAGLLIHKGAAYLGLNRSLAAAGVPLIRV